MGGVHEAHPCVCCAAHTPRCRKVSRGNSEQAPRCAHRCGTDHLPRPCAGGMVADDLSDRHRSLASARSACCCPKRRGAVVAPHHLAPDCGNGRRGRCRVCARNGRGAAVSVRDLPLAAAGRSGGTLPRGNTSVARHRNRPHSRAMGRVRYHTCHCAVCTHGVLPDPRVHCRRLASY